MIVFILKWTLCLALLTAFYHLFLEKEKMHHFNRFYLLLSVFISAIIPFITFEIEGAAATEIISLPINDKISHTSEVTTGNTLINLEFFLLAVYLTISSMLVFRFVSNLFRLLEKAKTNEAVVIRGATLILVDDKILPHSFWNYIFVNKQQYLQNEIEEELFTHELAHIRQKHTIDVLLLEIIQLLFWFNPVIYWIKKSMQLNHEFLADEHVISSYKNISKYQYLLLEKATWDNTYYLASNLNYSLTKKRLLKMKTKNSNIAVFIKKLAVIPIMTGLVVVFSTKVEAQQTKKKPVVKEVSNKQSASRDEMKEYNILFKESTTSEMYKLRDVERMKYIYNKMSEKQKASVKNIKDVLPPKPKVSETPPPPSKSKVVDLPPAPPKPEKSKAGKKVNKTLMQELPSDITYFINGTKVTKKEVENLDKTQIDEVKVTKNDDGKGIIEITTLKK